MNGYMMAMRRYAEFSGRSARAEYWFFILFYIVGYAICYAIDVALFGPKVQVVSLLFSLAHLLPSLAVGIRRLHDLDRTGWWILLPVTGIGWIVLLVWYCMRGTPGPNRFGYPTTEPALASAT